ncbi:hypothetical protein TSYNTROOL_01070 [Tepidanaerobacter syntrophicus]|uniref:hypothetical protein n=1 Tax=Tepidanaerobacter syntrophicus TaxID=224999 RepID=UPI0022EF162A|nr:hypothetical protein [Tepidanaerobacter syntrophicus]GLI50021.1 hypothetical protein TSYNTROOL_01070 [Tepidanaerobacter syntrophicus]
MNKELITNDDKSIKQTASTTTFVIKVLYCENASVQGYIQWLEDEKTVPFRSLMELIHLMEEALEKEGKGLVKFRSWEADEA